MLSKKTKYRLESIKQIRVKFRKKIYNIWEKRLKNRYKQHFNTINTIFKNQNRCLKNKLNTKINLYKIQKYNY